MVDVPEALTLSPSTASNKPAKAWDQEGPSKSEGRSGAG